MGARGPKPLPSALKQARGTYRPDRAAPCEAVPTGKPSCPAWLSMDAKKEFRRLVRQLSGMGLLGAIDQNALVRYVDTWVRWRQAQQLMEKSGILSILKGPDGKVSKVKPSPLVAISRSLAEQLSRLEADFGMNPSSRSRINVSMPAGFDDDNTERFFRHES